MDRERVELGVALDSLQAAVPRCTKLLREVPDPTVRAIGSWSVGDVAAHLASVFENNVAMIEGAEPVLAVTTVEIERMNSKWLEDDPDRDPAAAASRIENALERLTDQLQGASGDAGIRWHEGLTLDPATVLCLTLGEVLVHGHDIATAARTRWTIEAGEAGTVLDGIIELAPQYVDEDAARNFSARYELRIRGGLQATLTFEDGGLTIGRPDGAADCRISADPVAFLLVAYGRISVWGPVLRGKMAAWGRRPWLGLKLPSLLRNP